MAIIEMFIDGWEIECCAPPPVIGETASWSLEFLPEHDPEPAPQLVREDLWTVTRDDRGATLVDRDGIRAVWNGYAVPAPESGIRRVRGRLLGVRHGATLPGELRRVTGRVQRIRLYSVEYAFDPTEPRVLTWVGGSAQFRDVRESPRWFGGGGAGRHETGLVVDLAVP